MWDATKTMLRENCVALQTILEKKKMSQQFKLPP